MLEPVDYAEDAYDAAAGAYGLVLVTAWNAFRSLDLERLKATMRVPVLVDLRNAYRRKEVETAGFRYTSVGRPDA